MPFVQFQSFVHKETETAIENHHERAVWHTFILLAIGIGYIMQAENFGIASILTNACLNTTNEMNIKQAPPTETTTHMCLLVYIYIGSVSSRAFEEKKNLQRI